jgi:hypothetical protein
LKYSITMFTFVPPFIKTSSTMSFPTYSWIICIWLSTSIAIVYSSECVSTIVATWCTPKFLDKLNYKSKAANNGRIRSWGTLLGSQHFGGRRVC